MGPAQRLAHTTGVCEHEATSTHLLQFVFGTSVPMTSLASRFSSTPGTGGQAVIHFRCFPFFGGGRFRVRFGREPNSVGDRCSQRRESGGVC